MEAEDDMIVLVVVDDDEKVQISEKDSGLEPSDASLEVDNIIETAQKHGEFISIKSESMDEEYECDYLEDEVTSETIKEESTKMPDHDNACDDDEYLPETKDDTEENTERHRFTMLKPWQQQSFVEELREMFEELKDDEELLVSTLEKIMRTRKPPAPPKDYYVMSGILLECVTCGHLSDTIPAASRHYQEKHGQRYLVCYACGVDFRSTTNLYKHEKRCIAPDAEIVLKARAIFLGRKGRGRPFLSSKKHTTKREKFQCSMCSATFITKSTLESHENLHRGVRPFRCHACPCAYTSYSALSRHTKKHSNAQFMCDHCSRVFKIKAALVAHMETHKPMRRYGCDECSRRFAQKSALKLHINRVHKNLPPPCACQICPKRYPRMSLLKAHMKRAHGMSIITRKMFFKSLPTMTELEVKESKIILKYDEDELLEFLPPIKTQPVVEEEPNYEEEYAEVTNEMKDLEMKQEEEMSVEDFIQYMTRGTQNTGGKVVYIKNGEVVSTNNEYDSREDSLILGV